MRSALKFQNLHFNKFLRSYNLFVVLTVKEHSYLKRLLKYSFPVTHLCKTEFYSYRSTEIIYYTRLNGKPEARVNLPASQPGNGRYLQLCSHATFLHHVIDLENSRFSLHGVYFFYIQSFSVFHPHHTNSEHDFVVVLQNIIKNFKAFLLVQDYQVSLCFILLLKEHLT